MRIEQSWAGVMDVTPDAIPVIGPVEQLLNLQYAYYAAGGALSRLKLVSWPLNGPALIREGDEAHLIDGWRYLGTVRSDEEIHALLAAGRLQFDRDTYRILAKYVARMTPLTLRPLSPDD